MYYVGYFEHFGFSIWSFSFSPKIRSEIMELLFGWNKVTWGHTDSWERELQNYPQIISQNIIGALHGAVQQSSEKSENEKLKIWNTALTLSRWRLFAIKS